jgi:hypothetical protein
MSLLTWFRSSAKRAPTWNDYVAARVSDLLEESRLQGAIHRRELEAKVAIAELDADYAKFLHQRKIKEAEEARELREQKRQNSKAGMAKLRARAQELPPPCPVCKDDHDIHLTARDIAWHHAGHPANFETPNWN